MAPSPSSRTSSSQLVGPVAHRHVGVAGAGVLERVGQALLHDPVRRQVDRRAGAGTARRRRAAGRAGPARPTSSSSESRASRPGWGTSSTLVAVAAHRGEQAAHLGQRRAPGLLDAAERVAVLAERVGELVPDGADLQHHHADGVGDDVVELARDPRTLLGHRDPRGRVPLPLGLGRAHLRRLGLLGPLAERQSPRASRSPNRSGMKTSSPTECAGLL